jgi:hypothetical protein
MLILYWAAAGFFTVFGWNTGQKVWDKYIEPPTAIVQTEKTNQIDKDK